MATEDKKPSGIFRRTLVVVFCLIVISVIIIWWGVNSAWLLQQTVSSAVARINSLEKSNLEISGLTGTVRSGLKIEQLRLKQAKPPFYLTAEKIALNLDFLSFAKNRPVFSGSIASISIQGVGNAPFASSAIPVYRGLESFAGAIAGVRPADFAIGSIEFSPWLDTELIFRSRRIHLEKPDEAGQQKIGLELTADLKGRRILSGDFSGNIAKRFSRLSGNLNVNLAGQKVSSELNISPDRGHYKIGGFISSASLDVTELSQWLIPIWQDVFPFGFDGRISGSGSWHYSSELGLLGNLSGNIENLRMVALGLFISVCEINSSWKFFDGSLSFADAGSLFMGFPAQISGKIESVFEPSRKWGVDFSCSTIDFAKLSDELPWGVKYTMALPPLDGMATFSLKLRASRPEISAFLGTEKLLAGKIAEQRKIAGTINYSLGDTGTGRFSIAMKNTVFRDAPPLWQRLKGRGSFLADALSNNSGPHIFEYSFEGADTSNLMLRGDLSRSGEKIGSARGHWHEGMGSALFMINDSSGGGENFVANNIPLLDFILMK